jgi:addiction module HigA family antidote
MASALTAAPKRGEPASHPGEVLKEIVLPALKAGGTPTARVAELVGLSRPSFYDFLGGKTPVTAELALKLGKLCGNGPDLWMNMQKLWDLDRAREKLGDSLDAIPTLKVA